MGVAGALLLVGAAALLYAQGRSDGAQAERAARHGRSLDRAAREERYRVVCGPQDEFLGEPEPAEKKPEAERTDG